MKSAKEPQPYRWIESTASVNLGHRLSP